MASRYTPFGPSPYLSRRDAAAFIGVNVRTIDRYLAAGTLDSVKIGPRLIRIPLASIEALIEGGSA